MRELNEKVVVITGAGSGIGQELTKQLVPKGAILALNDWNAESLETTWQQLPKENRGIKAVFDVGDRQAIEEFAQQCRKQLGRVDLVINNAGMSVQQTPIIYSKIEQYEKVLQVNLWGVLYSSLAFLPMLREQEEAGLVNVSSVFGLMGFPGSAPYNVSKFGVRGFTETLRVEMRNTGLYVGCVHPGGIKTNIANNIEFDDPVYAEKFRKDFDRQAKTTAQEAAKVILHGIEQKNPRILIGRDARTIDRFTRLIPSSYERILARWLKPERFLKPRN